MILISIFISQIFLEEFYIYNNKNILNDVYKEAITLETTDEIIRLAHQNEVEIIALDTENNMIYSSRPTLYGVQNSNFKDAPVIIKNAIESKNFQVNRHDYIKRLGVNDIRLDLSSGTRNSKFYTTEREDEYSTDLTLVSLLEDGEMIVISKSVPIIRENVSIASKFLLIVAGITLSFGSLIIYIYTRKITEPIEELSSYAKEIANQNFDYEVNIKSKDEVGLLAENMSYISHKFDESITVLKEELSKKQEQEQKRQNFISNTSHELKTPIGIIKGYSEAIKYGVYTEKDEVENGLDVIIEESNKMTSLVEEMLRLALTENSTIELNKETFDLNKLVNKILVKLDSELKNNNVKLSTNLNGELLVNADIQKIEQVLINYIVNAKKYSNDFKIIEISTHEEGSYVTLDVYNSCERIAEEELARIWDSFYKIDKARTREKGGFGLGLSIVKLIIEAHSGEVRVEQNENGIIFSFSIPKN